ncbi:MAG: fumarylacetoacetate hydrolase family protein [Bacteroidetes bacterium]|nr:fumarylacetoacetate hydrolase family protein [Bacteroidota bacterium]
MKIICIGRNYLDHAKELNSAIPKEPVFFLKPDSALLIRNRPFYYPEFSHDVHYEVELVLKIKRVGKNILEENANTYIDSIGLGIDFTARDIQRQCIKEGLPWEVAKAFDRSAVISDDFIPRENFSNLGKIEFHLNLNGITVQKGNSRDMIFNFAKLIEHVSRFMTLKMGDLIYTGTPAGVGPVKIGDRLEGFIGAEKLLDFKVK